MPFSDQLVVAYFFGQPCIAVNLSPQCRRIYASVALYTCAWRTHNNFGDRAFNAHGLTSIESGII